MIVEGGNSFPAQAFDFKLTSLRRYEPQILVLCFRIITRATSTFLKASFVHKINKIAVVTK